MYELSADSLIRQRNVRFRNRIHVPQPLIIQYIVRKHVGFLRSGLFPGL